MDSNDIGEITLDGRLLSNLKFRWWYPYLPMDPFHQKIIYGCDLDDLKAARRLLLVFWTRARASHKLRATQFKVNVIFESRAPITSRSKITQFYNFMMKFHHETIMNWSYELQVINSSQVLSSLLALSLYDTSRRPGAQMRLNWSSWSSCVKLRRSS